MQYTKRQLIDEALSKVGLDYTFDKDPQEYVSALMQLEGLIASHAAQGRTMPYNKAAALDTAALDQLTGLPDWAFTGIVHRLAMIIAPNGKSIEARVLQAAKEGEQAIIAGCMREPPISPPKSGMPVGYAYGMMWPYNNFTRGADGV